MAINYWWILMRLRKKYCKNYTMMMMMINVEWNENEEWIWWWWGSLLKWVVLYTFFIRFYTFLWNYVKNWLESIENYEWLVNILYKSINMNFYEELDDIFIVQFSQIFSIFCDVYSSSSYFNLFYDIRCFLRHFFFRKIIWTIEKNHDITFFFEKHRKWEILDIKNN